MSFANIKKARIRKNEENLKNNIHPETAWIEKILNPVIFFSNIVEFDKCMNEFCKKNRITLVKNSPKTNFPHLCKHSTYNVSIGYDNGDKSFETTYDFNLTAPILDSSGNGIILKAQLRYTSLPPDIEYFKDYFQMSSISFPADIVRNIKETELKRQIINPFNNDRYDFIRFRVLSKKYKEHKITMTAVKDYTEITEALLPKSVSKRRFDNSIFKNISGFKDYYIPDRKTVDYILEFIGHFMYPKMETDEINGISIFERDILNFFQKYSKYWIFNKEKKQGLCKLICKDYLSGKIFGK